jgi:hypothetical protein
VQPLPTFSDIPCQKEYIRQVLNENRVVNLQGLELPLVVGLIKELGLVLVESS